jgi:Domain of unknown function (DUF5671)
MAVIGVLLLIAVLVAVPLILLTRKRPSGSGGSPAEILVYLILAVATLLATNAFSSLVELILPTQQDILGGTDELALSLSTLIVAGAVAFLLWRRLEAQQVIGDRPARALYVSLVIAYSMAVVAVSSARILIWIVGQNQLSEIALADLIAFGVIWLLHERVRIRGAGLDVLRSLAGSLLGLMLAVTGLVTLLRSVLEALFQVGTVVAGSGVWDGVILGLVWLAVGVPYLWWFWFRDVVRSPSVEREGYATLVAIVAWFVGIVAVSGLLYSGLVRALALDPAGLTSSPFPIQISLSITAGLAYWHHRDLLGSVRTGPVRVMAYLFSSAAFVVGAAAFVTLIVNLIDNLTEGSVAGTGARTVLAALVALVVSGAVLGIYWVPAQRLAKETDEIRSAPRRVAIVGLLTTSAVTAVGGLIAVVYALLRAVMGSSADIGDVLTWSVPLTAVTGLLTWYFARIRPRRAESDAEATEPKELTVTLVASDPGPLPGMLYKARLLRRTDGVGVIDPQRATEIVAALAKINTPAALVIVGADSFDVIPLA